MTNKMSQILIAIIGALALCSMAQVAEAGRGGSAGNIRQAIRSGSSDAIIAEVERAERLICAECVTLVMGLLDDDRYEIREVAAWWFARRPAYRAELTQQSIERLAGTDAIQARNAADILGAFGRPEAILPLAAAVQRTDLTAEARLHAARALGRIGNAEANQPLSAAMGDADAGVRREAVIAWQRIRGQSDAAPVVALLSDSDVTVRREAAAAAGKLREEAARAGLEALVTGDSDAMVRRNAAWALGRIGDGASRGALEQAQSDASPLVRMTARNALRSLR